MASHIGRRKFLATLLGGAAAAWPLVARARQPKLPTIGFLGSTTPSAMSQWVAAFVQRLRELGWVDGRNVAIEYRGEGRIERFSEIADEFRSKTREPSSPLQERPDGAIMAFQRAGIWRMSDNSKRGCQNGDTVSET